MDTALEKYKSFVLSILSNSWIFFVIHSAQIDLDDDIPNGKDDDDVEEVAIVRMKFQYSYDASVN